MSFKNIYKITSNKLPNECCFYWSGHSGRHPETQFKSIMKDRLKKWKAGKSPLQRPYFRFAEDIQVVAQVVGRTALQDAEELDKYCAALTSVYNSQIIEQEEEDQTVNRNESSLFRIQNTRL